MSARVNDNVNSDFDSEIDEYECETEEDIPLSKEEREEFNAILEAMRSGVIKKRIENGTSFESLSKLPQ